MVVPDGGMEHNRPPPLPYPPGQQSEVQANGVHHPPSPSSLSTAVTQSGGERRMGLNEGLEAVADDLNGMVHGWDKTRDAMEYSVDENLRSLAYQVAEGRVIRKLMEQGVQVIDGPRSSTSARHRSDNRARSTPPSTRSPPPISLSPSSSPPRSPSVATASVEGAVVNGAAGLDSQEYGALQLSGFDLRASMESGDIAEVKGHVRLLHDLAAQQEEVLEELNSESLYALELNEKLSRKLMDKSKELDMLKKAYYLAIEGGSAPASASIEDAPAPAPSSLPTEPALEAVSTGMTPPPPPRPPRSDSVTAARREHSRAFSGLRADAVGGRGENDREDEVEEAAAADREEASGEERVSRGRTRTRAGVNNVSPSTNGCIRTELFPPEKSQDMSPGRLHKGGDASALPPPPASFFPQQPSSAPILGPGDVGAASTNGYGSFGGAKGGLATSSNGNSVTGSPPTTPRSNAVPGLPAFGGQGVSAPPISSGPPLASALGLGGNKRGDDGTGGGTFVGSERRAGGRPEGDLLVGSSAPTTPKSTSPFPGRPGVGAQGLPAPPLMSGLPSGPVSWMSGEEGSGSTDAGGLASGSDRGVEVRHDGGGKDGSGRATTTRSRPPSVLPGAGGQGVSAPPMMSGPPTGAAEWGSRAGGSESNASDAFRGPSQDSGNATSGSALEAMMMPPAPLQQLQQQPPAAEASLETAARKNDESKSNSRAPPTGPPPVLPHPGQAMSFRAVKKKPARGDNRRHAGFGGMPPPTGFGGRGTGPFGGPKAGPVTGFTVSREGDGAADVNVTKSLEAMSVEGGGGHGGTIPNGTGEHSSAGYGSSFGGAADGFVDTATQPTSLQQAGDHDSDTGDLNGGNTGAQKAEFSSQGVPEGVAETAPVDQPENGTGKEDTGGGGDLGFPPWAKEEETNDFFAGV